MARMGVLTALAILAGLIVVHEAGHFFAATWQGIRVSGFSVGFGPVLLQRQRRGEQFFLLAISRSEFVSFQGDAESSTNHAAPSVCWVVRWGAPRSGCTRRTKWSCTGSTMPMRQATRAHSAWRCG